MKLLILQEKLKEGLEIVERVFPKTPSLPILSNTLLKTEKNFLNLTTTDLEIALRWWGLAKIEQEGQIAIPTRLFSSFVNFLPNKQVILEKKGFNLSIECENYRTILNGLNPEEFPIIPNLNIGESVSVESKSFCECLKSVVDIPVISSVKPEISGIFLVFRQNFIKMVATDSFRLGEKTFYLSHNPLSKEYALIIPQKTAREIINIFGEKEGNLQIYFSVNQIMFELLMEETTHPHIQLISRLIEGEFPNYEEVVPKKFETQVIFQKNEFLKQVKSASLFSGKINEIKLKIDPKKEKVEIFSQTPDLGSYYSFLPAKIKGKELEISFNHRFLVDGLLNIKSPEVIFELNRVEQNKETRPSVLKPVGSEDYFYIVMPTKTT